MLVLVLVLALVLVLVIVFGVSNSTEVPERSYFKSNAMCETPHALHPGPFGTPSGLGGEVSRKDVESNVDLVKFLMKTIEI